MIENDKICINCMSELDEEKLCRVCGFDESNYSKLKFLPSRTVLKNRYFVGKVEKSNNESVVYIGYDKLENKKIFISEFFPSELSSRQGLIVVPEKDNVVSFKNYIAEYGVLYKSLKKIKSIKHIISVFDVFYENGTVYAVYEHFEAITFEEYIKRAGGYLSWEALKEFLPPILTTISLFHNENKFHLGISTQTIMITSNKEVKITGFSVTEARIAGSNLIPELFSGYAAPEQYSETENVGIQSDIYSICAVIYRALTGVTLPEAHTRGLVSKVLDCNKIVKEINSYISDAVKKGISVDKNLRFSSINELVATLFSKNVSPTLREKSDNTTSFTRVFTKIDDEKSKKKNMFLLLYSYVMTGLFIATLLSLIIFVNKKPNFDSDFYKKTANENTKEGLTLAQDNFVIQDDSLPQISNGEVGNIANGLSTDMFLADENEKAKSVYNVENMYIEVDEKELVVPDFKGFNYELLSKKFSDILKFSVNMEYSDEFLEGIVISQSIKDGTEILKGSEIELTVSRGSKYIKVPEFEGMMKKEYLDILDSLGIKYQVEVAGFYGVIDDSVTNVSLEVNSIIDVTQNTTLIVYVSKNMVYNSTNE